VSTDGYHMTVTIPLAANVAPILSRFVTVTSVLAGRIPTVLDGDKFPIHALTAHFTNASRPAAAGNRQPSASTGEEVAQLREVVASQEARIVKLEKLLLG
jgi:hypothetical protein